MKKIVPWFKKLIHGIRKNKEKTLVLDIDEAYSTRIIVLYQGVVVFSGKINHWSLDSRLDTGAKLQVEMIDTLAFEREYMVTDDYSVWR